MSGPGWSCSMGRSRLRRTGSRSRVDGGWLWSSGRGSGMRVADARLLLVLAPWPGDGHPGAMTLDEKAHVRERARDRAEPG